MSLAPLGHIEIDERGVARVAGSRTKVAQIVLDATVRDWSPDEIKSQYPHLSLADIHAAMAFYYDHQEEVDAQIDKDRADFEALRASAAESPIVERLRAEGKLP
jgi:uncharacterized protein (DUF433 family)